MAAKRHRADFFKPYVPARPRVSFQDDSEAAAEPINTRKRRGAEAEKAPHLPPSSQSQVESNQPNVKSTKSSPDSERQPRTAVDRQPNDNMGNEQSSPLSSAPPSTQDGPITMDVAEPAG
ncbi:MAG: hypothetical protein M1824_001499, partial [Vezdaea acicularis]